jgi:BON domain
VTATIATCASADADLARRVVLFLEQRHLIGGARLRVSADRGVVAVRGVVPTFHLRQLIVSAARRVAGATQIIDELEVDPPRTASLRTRVTQNAALLATTIVLIVGFLLAGCGQSGPPRVATHPTKGSVTYQGQPAAGAFLALHPKGEPKSEAPTPTAIVQADGTFAVSTYDSGDGVPAGDYVVTIQWRKAVKSGNDYLPGPNLLPTRYGQPETSNLVVHVAAGQNDLPPIVLKR